jgi:sec-independent protein translocase protein TatA
MHPLLVDIGPGEVLIVLAVLLLVFGSSQLPKLGKSLGEAMREVRQWGRDDERAET